MSEDGLMSSKRPNCPALSGGHCFQLTAEVQQLYGRKKLELILPMLKYILEALEMRLIDFVKTQRTRGILKGGTEDLVLCPE